jgi:MEMO1 family protein
MLKSLTRIIHKFSTANLSIPALFKVSLRNLMNNPGLGIFFISITIFSCKTKKPEEKVEIKNIVSTENTKKMVPQKIRKMIFAHKRWYSSDKETLNKQLDQYLNTKPEGNKCSKVTALIAPHAGYYFSGKTAGKVFSSVKNHKPSRVIVLGLSHRVFLKGLSVGKYTHYETPLGLLPVDQEAVEYIFNQKHDFISFNETAHENEHSVEMELPFIYKLFGKVPIITVLVGKMDDNSYKKAGKLLSGLMNENSIIVVSNDFTHRGPKFRYEPFKGKSGDELKKELKELDMGAYNHIELLNRKSLLDYKKNSGITMCGIRPIALLLEIMLQNRGAINTKIQGYTNSGEITKDYKNTVSYMGISFCKSSKELLWGIDKLQQKTLHTIVKRVLNHVTKDGFNPRDFDPNTYIKGLDISGLLSEKRAPFVTLKKNNRLRGCIGYLKPHGVLWKAVAQNAMSAALYDRRFSPVSFDEVKNLHIEVSVLSLPSKVNSYKDIIIGKHGMTLFYGRKRSTFLPQVAPARKWSLDTTLRHLATKAGISPEEYKKATYEVYTAQVF